MAKAIDIARYILWLAASEPEAEPISHMRLQKLLYYAQGWRLAMRGESLFDDPINGWVHGPVVRSVYPAFSRYDAGAIPSSEAEEGEKLACDEMALVESIWENYKKYSAAELRKKTHSEEPWLESRRGMEPEERGNRVISRETMRNFFRDQYKQFARPGLTLDRLERAEQELKSGQGVLLSSIRERLANALPSQTDPGGG
ncbi:MAG: DUF4065 domain-containing protein [Phycisphaerales bacterium]|nr:DUF4065 domain-containing protein [Phycisphaerales bacterium]